MYACMHWPGWVGPYEGLVGGEGYFIAFLVIPVLIL